MADHDAFETDRFATSAGELTITFLGHGSLLFGWVGRHIYVDPYGRVADYSRLSAADLVLVTHEHGDHLDTTALAAVRRESTIVVLTNLASRQVSGGTVMRNGDEMVAASVAIAAVPAYNVVHMRSPGVPYHPPGHGNGYVLGFGDKRVYVAGDTENIPEMRALAGVDIAFLPMNLPYTMSPEMLADAALMLRPRVLYPYHFGDSDTHEAARLLRDEPEIEVRIRRMA